MAERGYPPPASETDPATLSREQAEVMRHYQAAHEIAAADVGDTDTDALYRAMVHYRMVFNALLESAVKQPAE